jgi:hypothetical protein
LEIQDCEDGETHVIKSGIQEYHFLQKRNVNGVWVCRPLEGGMCWTNKLYGLPCDHILKRWSTLIRGNDVGEDDFDFKDIERTVHKMYRRSTYTRSTVKIPKLQLSAITSQPTRGMKNLNNLEFKLKKIKDILDVMARSTTTDAPFDAMLEILHLRSRGKIIYIVTKLLSHMPFTSIIEVSFNLTGVLPSPDVKWKLLHQLLSTSSV